MTAGVASHVRFDVEGVLFDEVPYRPWYSPLGQSLTGSRPRHRRVVGRLDEQVVSVTDLPPDIVHRSLPPGYAHPQQYFERAGDFVDWIVNTAAGTRFFGVGRTWDEQTRRAVATLAVETGLEWDSEGSIIIVAPPGEDLTRPGIYDQRASYRVQLWPDGTWQVYSTADPAAVALTGADLTRVLAGPLYDVCCDGDPFAFEVLPSTGPAA